MEQRDIRREHPNGAERGDKNTYLIDVDFAISKFVPRVNRLLRVGLWTAGSYEFEVMPLSQASNTNATTRPDGQVHT